MGRPPEKEAPRGQRRGQGRYALIILALLFAAVVGAVAGAVWLGDAIAGWPGDA
jgi:hypothetical protein